MFQLETYGRSNCAIASFHTMSIYQSEGVTIAFRVAGKTYFNECYASGCRVKREHARMMGCWTFDRLNPAAFVRALSQAIVNELGRHKQMHSTEAKSARVIKAELRTHHQVVQARELDDATKRMNEAMQKYGLPTAS